MKNSIKFSLSGLFAVCTLISNAQGTPKRFEKDSVEVNAAILEIEKGNYENAFKISLEKATHK